MIVNIPADFTLSELLAHLRREDGEAAGCYRTAREWADYFGLGASAMRAILREAKAQKKLLCQRQKRARLDDIIAPVPVYAFDLSDGEGEK